jgi:ribosome biogenesis protein ENP2
VLTATDAAVQINAIDVNEYFDVIATGGVDGRIECWDAYNNKRVAELDVAAALVAAEGAPALQNATSVEVTTVRYDPSGMHLAVGMSTGHCLLFDVRSRQPLLIKDHQYGLPIKVARFHSSGRLVTADAKVAKIWSQTTGELFTSIEPEYEINDVSFAPIKATPVALSDAQHPEHSGLLYMAVQQPQIGIYFVPELGPAPRWCSFLENLTEELEEASQGQVYDDFKFVTRKELEELGLTHLIGTNLLRAAMHGFFMDIRLYNRAKAISEPFAFDEYRKKRVQEKIEEQRANRIRIRERLPKVNRVLAKELLQKTISTGAGKVATTANQAAEAVQELEAASSGAGKDVFANPLRDERFSQLFSNPDFEIDLKSDEFKRLHPSMSGGKKSGGSTGAAAASAPEALRKLFEEVDEDVDSDVEDDLRRKGMLKQVAAVEEEAEMEEQRRKLLGQGGALHDEDDEDDEDDADEGMYG